jgi:hypothetical protein
LKETARDRIRPSTSGRATFMAMSRAERPFMLSRHWASVPPEKTTWMTGQSRSSKGVARRSAPGLDSAKPVAFSTISAPASASRRRTTSAETLSFRLAA